MWYCLKSLLLLNLCLFCHANSTCVQIDSNYWKETWSSNFADNAEMKDKWEITNEYETCSGNGASQISCNTAENVHVDRGYLYLQTRHTKHYDYNYTGANIDSVRAFPKGRYEIRARMTAGDFIQATIMGLGDSSDFSGQMNIVSYVSDNIHYRGVHFANENKDFNNHKHRFDSTSEAARELTRAFHVYGVEWSEKGYRFSFDDVYTMWTNFTDTQNLTGQFLVRIQVGVGGSDIKYKIPDTFKGMNWTCPAMIVDYVRIYERLDQDYDCQAASYFKNQTELDAETKQVDEFCSKLQIEKLDTFNDAEESSSISKKFQIKSQYVVVGLLLLFTVAIVWMIVLLRRVHKRLTTNDKTPNNDAIHFNGSSGKSRSKDGDEIYEEVEDYCYESFSGNDRFAPYLELSDAERTEVYLQMINQYDHLCPDAIKHPENLMDKKNDDTNNNNNNINNQNYDNGNAYTAAPTATTIA